MKRIQFFLPLLLVFGLAAQLNAAGGGGDDKKKASDEAISEVFIEVDAIKDNETAARELEGKLKNTLHVADAYCKVEKGVVYVKYEEDFNGCLKSVHDTMEDSGYEYEMVMSDDAPACWKRCDKKQASSKKDCNPAECDHKKASGKKDCDPAECHGKKADKAL